jgi:hypothetical protein
VRIIPAQPRPDGTGAKLGPPAAADSPGAWPEDSDVRIIPARPKPDRTDPEPDSPL